jgi:hypothetical protein
VADERERVADLPGQRIARQLQAPRSRPLELKGSEDMDVRLSAAFGRVL